MLQDIAVEAAFPQSAIYRAEDWNEPMEKLTMSVLEHGTLYLEGHRNLLAGSRGEGLAMESDWGHPDADYDVMSIDGGPMGVYVAGGQRPRGGSCLDFRPEQCPAAYCKLEVKDLGRLRESRLYDGGKWCDDSCVKESDGTKWIDTYNAVRKMRKKSFLAHANATITGPAAQLMGNRDYVRTLVCSGPHPDLHHEFPSRSRGAWPPASLIKYILQMPMLLVLVGHKGSPESEFRQQARTSWSHLELKLIQGLPESVRQGYIACKYVMKRFLEVHRGQNKAVDGVSVVCSYHIKTVFLRFLEKIPPSMITSPFALLLDLLRELDEYIKVGKLPHYFLADCNLLETVACDERSIARQAIKHILSDPLNALLTSPTDPQQIYGEVCPKDLVVAFQHVSAHLTHAKRRKLSKLLARVDERRRERFEKMLQQDRRGSVRGSLGVLGRPDLTGLAEMLKEIKSI